MRTSDAVVIANAEALIWDFDDTMFKSKEQFERIATVMAPEFGCPPPDRDVIRANCGGSLSDTMSAVLGKVSMSELQRRVARFQELQRDEYENPAEHMFEDALDLAERAAARGLTQIIVTNRMHEGNGNASPRVIVEKTVLRDWIAQVICRDDVEHGHYKPDARVMGTSLVDRGINPRNAVVIGDQHYDAGLAKELDAPAVIVCRDSDKLVNAHMLPDGWQDHVTFARSLHQVHFGFITIPRQFSGGQEGALSLQTRRPMEVPAQRFLPGYSRSSEILAAEN